MSIIKTGVKTVAKGALIGVASAVLLSGCSFLDVQPQEVRRADTNQYLEDIDYTTVGEVLSDEWSTGASGLDPTWYKAVMEGPNIYEELDMRTRALPKTTNCGPKSDSQSTCRVGLLEVFIQGDPDTPDKASIFVNDACSSRD